MIFLLFLPSMISSNQRKGMLAGITIAIDSGHGGNDQGASFQDVYEAPLNLEIAKKIEKKLADMGATIIMTRTDEKDLVNENVLNRKKEDMKKRMEIINDEKNDLMISIHMNKYTSEDVHGIHVFYSDQITSSKEIATLLQNAINQQFSQNKSIKKQDFYLLRNAMIPSVLIECGFLSNASDRNNLQKESYQNQIAECIVQGITAYYQTKGFV